MRYAVIDVETTGVYPGGHDRIVEVAIVGLTSELMISNEFTSLLNPGRDIGPTWLHGIQTGDVLDAPTFSDVAGTIADLLRGALVVGHNVGFDLRFLESEFARAGSHIQRPPHFDTMSLALEMGAPSRRLEEACELFGIDLSHGHSALGDARATAALFARCVEHFGHERLGEWIAGPTEAAHLDWPTLETRRKPWPRERAAEQRRDGESYLASLVRDLPVSQTDPGDWQAYYAVLDRALEDRRISKDEAAALRDTAIEAGLSSNEVKAANETYLRSLISVALHDHVVTESERRDIDEVAHLLALKAELPDLLAEPSAEEAHYQTGSAEAELPGRTVCFTGAMNASIDGERATRERATEIALEHGMIVVKGVTKKLDYLIVADPDSLSSKAQKARKYGTRILAESVFWNLVRVSTDG